MSKIRMIRILEYYGEESWIQLTLNNSLTSTVFPDGMIHEISRFVLDSDEATEKYFNEHNKLSKRR